MSASAPAVLIIDDAVFLHNSKDQALFHQLKELLAKELPGFEFLLADTWNDAKCQRRASELLISDREACKRIRLILLDLIFEEQDLQGDGILEEIQRVMPVAASVPVVILTIDRRELPQAMAQRLVRLGADAWQSKDSINEGRFDAGLREVLCKVKAPRRLRVVQHEREMLIQIVNGFNREVLPGKGVVVPWPVDVVIQRCIENPQRRVSFTDDDVLLTFGQENAESVRAMSKVKRRNEVVDRKLRSWLSHEISRFNDKLLEKGLDGPLILGDGVKGRTAKRLSIPDIERQPG